MEAVYDRTLDDVLAKNKKGTLNVEDLNRVGVNLSQTAEELGDSFVPDSFLREDKPTVSQYERILGKLSSLRGEYLVYPDTPPLPSMPLNHFEKWNAVEKNIHDLHEISQANRGRKLFCGESVTGEGGII